MEVTGGRVRGGVEAAGLADVQLDAIARGESVTAAAPPLGLEPERRVVRQGTGDVVRGEDGHGTAERTTGAFVGEPADAVLAQAHLVVTAEMHQLLGRLR